MYQKDLDNVVYFVALLNLIREAAKKIIFLVAGPLRGGGGGKRFGP